MRDTEQRSISSEKYLSITTPLVNHLNFDGMTKYSNYIILGRAVEIPDLDPYTRIYLNQISTITRSLPDQDQPISLEKYIKEVRRLREATFSGPSYFNPAMVKSEALDPELAEICWQIFNFPWCTGYSPKF